jgi:hypothetical protein
MTILGCQEQAPEHGRSAFLPALHTRIIEQLRASSETITPEELRRISPLAFSHVIPNSTYFTQHTTLECDGDPHGHMSPVDMEAASDA